MPRPALPVLAVALLAVAVGIAVWHVASAPKILRIAVGPGGSEDARLVAAAAQYLKREHAGIRLKLVGTTGEAESAKAVDDERADLAIVRTDVAIPARAQTVAVMHRDAAVLVAIEGKGITDIESLRGRTVGLVRRPVPNGKLLEALLGFYEVPVGAVATVPVEDPAQLEDAFRSGRIDAALAVGTLSGRSVTETVAAATRAADGAALVFVPINEAEAIAQRFTLYETIDIVRGSLGGAPPRPAETMKTISVNHRLVASTSLDDATVSELTRLLFSMRPTLAVDVPLANRIEGPDTSKSSSLPVHPGASAYYDGEIQTFFERYEDWIYLSIMGLSILGSGFAGLASATSSRRRARMTGLLDQLLSVIRRARVARGEAELVDLEAEADDILADALGRAGSGRLDDGGVAAFTLAFDQARSAIAERRRVLDRPYPPLALAAE
jgi:TRAP transporter TAXI family solute receptor